MIQKKHLELKKNPSSNNIFTLRNEFYPPHIKNIPSPPRFVKIWGKIIGGNTVYRQIFWRLKFWDLQSFGISPRFGIPMEKFA